MTYLYSEHETRNYTGSLVNATKRKAKYRFRAVTRAKQNFKTIQWIAPALLPSQKFPWPPCLYYLW